MMKKIRAHPRQRATTILYQCNSKLWMLAIDCVKHIRRIGDHSSRAVTDGGVDKRITVRSPAAHGDKNCARGYSPRIIFDPGHGRVCSAAPCDRDTLQHLIKIHRHRLDSTWRG